MPSTNLAGNHHQTYGNCQSASTECIVNYLRLVLSLLKPLSNQISVRMFPSSKLWLWTFGTFEYICRVSSFMESVTPGRGTTSSEEQSTDGCCRYNWASQLNPLECGYWRSKRPCKRPRLMKTMESLDPEQLNAWSFAHSKNQSAALAFSWRRPCWFLHQTFSNFATCTYSSYYTLAFFRSPFLSGVHQTTRLSWVIIDMYPSRCHGRSCLRWQCAEGSPK